MCGIIGYSGNDNAEKIILNGLHSLEYRGYDSAGLTVFDKNGFKTIKTKGRVTELETKTKNEFTENTFCGIGHTRWATHGKPSETNAHPHGTKNLMIVHNGIIENYNELKNYLIKKGYTFESDTDTEVAAKLLDFEYSKTKNHLTAIRDTISRLKGSYALGIVFKNAPDTVFAAKKDSPLLLGTSKNGNFIASDISAFLSHTNKYMRLNDGETAKITKDFVNVFDRNGNEKQCNWQTASWNSTAMEKCGYSHFMLKEIAEEPTAMKNTFESITDNFLPDFSGTIDDDFFKNINKIHITACGTAYHAGLIGKYYIEKLTHIPVTVETAGEFRYSDPIVSENDMVIIISQSGETADSLAALRLMNDQKIRTLSVVNTIGSTIANDSDRVIYTVAGPEISVASTKAFSVQTLVLLIFAIKTALINKKISEIRATEILKDFTKVYNEDIDRIIDNTDEIRHAAKILAKSSNAFFIGRGYDSYLAMEASLKLKEISYIHSEAYPAGELKHGTISLIENGTPVIAIATNRFFYDKMRSNIEEVKSRGATVISVCPKDADIITEISDTVIHLPKSFEFTSPFTAATAVQLLAYYTATELGRDIDKPKNLAKSVTVE